MRKFLAFVLVSVTLMASICANAQPPRRVMTPNDTLKSVRVLPDGTTVFSIYAPKAINVSLAGDAVPWGQPLVPTEKNGVWSCRIRNRKPGACGCDFVGDAVPG